MSDTDFATLYKLKRAGKHLKNLNRTITRFLNGKASGVINDITTEPGYLVVRAFSRRSVPPSCSGLIGETLYHQRAALDYWVCELTRFNKQAVNEFTGFPIFLEPKDFRNPVSGKLTWNARKQIGLLRSDHRVVIEDEQPFQGQHGKPEDDPLWLLYLLSNYDRHQFIHLTSIITNASSQNFTPPEAAARFEQVSISYGAFEHEGEVARFRILDGPTSQVEVDSNVKFDVAFDHNGPGAGRPVLATLGAIGMRVAEVIERLIRLV